MTNKWWHQPSLEMRKQGKSSRQIAKDLFGKSSMKSSVNYFFNKWDAENNYGVENTGVVKQGKVNYLFFDLETSPERTLTFGRFKQNIGDTQVLSYSHILTVAWAFNDGEVKSSKLSHKDIENEDDLTAIIDLVEAINKADVIVTFNGVKFDLKYLKTRMLKWGLPPLKPVKHIDLFLQAKKHFRFPSNSMNNICKYLGYSELKTSTDFDLWKRCINYKDKQDCETALTEMEMYNRQDIVVTRNLFKQIQGWTTGINVGTILNSKENVNETIRCPKCGSDDINAIDSELQVGQSMFSLYRCGDCRGVSRINAKGSVLLDVV